MSLSTPYACLLADDPTNLALWKEHSAWILRHDGDPSSIRLALDAYQRTCPGSLDLHLWVAHRHAEALRYDDAIDTLSLTAENQRSSLWHLNMALLLSLSGNLLEAGNTLAAFPPLWLARSLQNNPIGLATVIRTLHLGNHTKTLRKLLKSLPMRQQKKPIIQGVLALFHYDEDQLHLAQRRAEACVAALPTSAIPHEALTTLGLIALGNADLKLASTYFNQILATNLHNSRANYGLGLCYMLQQSLEKARDHLEIAVIHCPRPHPGLLLVFAFLLMISNQLQTASDKLDQVEHINPNNADLYAARALHAALSNQTPRIATHLTKARRLNPTSLFVIMTDQWLASSNSHHHQGLALPKLENLPLNKLLHSLVRQH